MTVTELISPQDYLAVERKSLDKHEYRAGRMVRMASTSSTHNLITANVAGTIGMQLRKRPTKIFLCNMRLWIPVINFYAYPDVSIVADEVCLNDNDERDILLNPTVIVEVLSASTEQYDRGEKFQSYRTIKTLQEYLMIAQDTHRVEQYVRQADGQWLFSEATTLSATLSLPSINCELPLRDVYDKVEIPAQSAPRHRNGHQG